MENSLTADAQKICSRQNGRAVSSSHRKKERSAAYDEVQIHRQCNLESGKRITNSVQLARISVQFLSQQRMCTRQILLTETGSKIIASWTTLLDFKYLISMLISA